MSVKFDEVKDRALGCFMGLAIGDALGAPVEFQAPGTFKTVTGYRAGGPFNLNAGEWTDDTSMALGLAEALRTDPELETTAVVDNWRAWHSKGAYSHNGRCFDIGNQTSAALRALGKGNPVVSTDSEGNGGIMRMAPVITRWWSNAEKCRELSIKQSHLTHNNPNCDHAAGILSDLAVSLVCGTWAAPEVHKRKAPYPSTGWVKHTSALAYWSLERGGSFEDMVLRVVNMGGDSDTAGAVTGMLAGAFHGLKAIPEKLVADLAWSEHLLKLAGDLFDASSEAQACN